MPFTDLPDTVALILNRLVACMAQVDATLRHFKFEPPDSADLPYSFWVAGESIGLTRQDLMAGLEEERLYKLYIVIAYDTESDDQDGSTAEAAAAPYIMRVKNYFWLYPRLQLASAPTSPFQASGESTNTQGTWTLTLQREVWMQDSGVLPFRERLEIEFTFNIKARLVIKNLGAFQ